MTAGSPASSSPRRPFRPARAVALSRTAAALLAVCLSLPAHGAAQDADPFAALVPRSIGPSGMSGRMTAVDVVAADPDVIWAGSATGGVWRSRDGGTTWVPVFDHQPVSSIGAIAIQQSAPDVVWVGTGEANPRNSAGVGRGVYRTRDGGETWEFLGLGASERIHRIVLDPTDPDVAYVAALGPAWSDGTERGVFRTRDGGDTWERVLYVDERTGASGLIMDPSNPRHLIASTWEFRRWPWFFESGGPGSGIHTSWDGGTTWTEVPASAGLPEGDLGRIGLAWAESDPRVVYALAEAGRTALLRSDDGGRTWATVNAAPGVSPRPFYFSDIEVDPSNENRIFRVAGSLDMSEDGGRSFTTIGGWSSVHPDHHDLWVSPDGQMLVDANDGGIYISRGGGRTWRFVENIPVAQFYHLDVDMAVPFNVFGGLQDNGSWIGPSQVWESPSFRGSTIMAHHWTSIGFGDGMRAVLLPDDPDFGFAQYQGGQITLFDQVTGTWKETRPASPDPDRDLRFNWNAGIALDPHETGTVYFGSQYLHRTRDRGRSWEILSPDLTTDDPDKQRQNESGGLTIDNTTAENHTSILAIAPSPVERGVIWVGTDDGNVQITRDDGATWTNVVDRIPDVPDATWAPHIEASRHAAGTAYVVFDDHRRGNWDTYVYRTTDFGGTWRRLPTDGVDGFAHVIEEDPEEPDLLFLGTEFGLYASLDAGRTWTDWGAGFPTVPVRSLVVHPRDGDLVVGTHGRAAWVIDDVRPLRALAAEGAVAEAPLTLFDPPPAYQHTRQTIGPFYFPGDARFHGDNRAYGALLTFHVSEAGLAEAAEEDGDARASFVVRDAAGDSLRAFTAPVRAGLNRAEWNLRRDGYRALVPDDTPEAFRPQGPEVPPGRYTVEVVLGDHRAETTVEVRPDPRRSIAQADRVAKWDAMERAGARLEQVTDAVRRLESTRETLALVQERVREDGSEALAERGDSLLARTDALLTALRQPPGVVGWVDDRSATTLLGQSMTELQSSYDAPTEAQATRLDRRDRAAADALADVDAFYTNELPSFRRAVEAEGLDLVGGGGDE